MARKTPRAIDRRTPRKSVPYTWEEIRRMEELAKLRGINVTTLIRMATVRELRDARESGELERPGQ